MAEQGYGNQRRCDIRGKYQTNFAKKQGGGLCFCSWAEFFASLALICFGLENICFNRYL